MTTDGLAGFRVLRPLGRGARSVVLLGTEDAKGAEPVALKSVDPLDRRLATEAAALERAAGEHVVRLLDVEVDRDCAVLVLERLVPLTLDALLAARSRLDAGELVTVLAPVATAVAAMHARGVAHGALHAGHIAFRADGAPVLVGFGAAELFAPGLPEVVLEGIPAVRADRDGMRELACRLLDADGTADAAALATELRAASPADVLSLLGRRVFGLAPAAPVRLEAERTEANVPVRAVAVAEPAVSATEPIPEPGRVGGPLGEWAAGLLPAGLLDRVIGERAVDAAPPGVRARVRDWWRGLAPGRRRLLLAGGAAGSTLLLASGVLGSPEPVTTVTPTPAASATESPGVLGHVAAEDDDPVGSAVHLLARRAACLEARSADCLDGADQPGSAAQERDLALIETELDPSGPPAGDPWLVDRWGDSALVAFPAGNDPAAVLLVRTEAGWRIREFYPAEDG